MILVRVLVFVLGVVVVVATLGAEIRTTVLPRAIPSRLTRTVFLATRWLFRVRAGKRPDYDRLDHVMAGYAPFSLLATLLVCLILVIAGFTGMFWALGHLSWLRAFELSGTSVTTLGFVAAPAFSETVLSVTEAIIGLALLALLITYLPSIYAAFSRRESAVAALEVRAGSPPSGAEMIWRYWVLERMHEMREAWIRWEEWFVEVEETHTTFPALVFFRSPQPDHSWITAAGAVLDAASLTLSSVDVPRDVQAEFCIRAGYLSLRRIADFFLIDYEMDPRKGDPISVTREEFDRVLDDLERDGVALKPDRDQAWLDFAGWRVNYDTVLITLAKLTIAPPAPWSSDRDGVLTHRPPLLRITRRPRRARRDRGIVRRP